MEIIVRSACNPSVPDSTTELNLELEYSFRERFKRSVRCCVRKGFTVEECFGLVWEEIMEEIHLPDYKQRRIFEDLLRWAHSERMTTVPAPR